MLLVTVFDHPSDSLVGRYESYQRGDVIAVHKNNEPWGLSEVNDPQWRIVLVPDLSEMQAHAMLVSEKVPPYNPQAPFRLRAFRLDLDKLHGFDRPRSAYIMPDGGTAPDLILTLQMMTEATEAKTFEDVRGIGPDTHVIAPTKTK